MICIFCKKKKIKQKGRLYCSHICANNATADVRKRQVAIKCQSCGNVFCETPGEIRYRGVVKYCSRKCMGIGRSKGKRKKVKCSNCGKIFSKLLSRLDKIKNTFCNVKCQRVYFREHPANKKNGFWHENGYKVLSIKGCKQGIREHIKIIQNNIHRKLKKGECVHHINGVRDDNRIENLRLMTNSEHIRLHRKLDVQNNKKLFGRT